MAEPGHASVGTANTMNADLRTDAISSTAETGTRDIRCGDANTADAGNASLVDSKDDAGSGIIHVGMSPFLVDTMHTDASAITLESAPDSPTAATAAEFRTAMDLTCSTASTIKSVRFEESDINAGQLPNRESSARGPPVRAPLGSGLF